MTEIDEKTAAKILFLSDRTCCICRVRGKKIQIHHIDGNHDNHKEENLAVLCLECHGDTLLKGGFDRKLSQEQVKVYRDDWMERVINNRANLDEKIVEDKISVKQKDKIFPIKSNDSIHPSLNQDVRNLLKRIGSEKISNLLQEAKLIAIDSGDKEMESWINKEFDGYVPPEGKKISRNQVKKTGFLPDYRDIQGKILVQISDGSIHELNYPVLMGQPITEIENLLDRYKTGNVRATISYTFPKDREWVGGQTGDIEITQIALDRIIKGIERKLSLYLEQKLSL